MPTINNPDSRIHQHQFLTAAVCLISIASVALLSGCREQPIVFHESVPVTRPIVDKETDGQEDRFRMISAIANQRDATWFFKLSGPIENIEKLQAGWGEFLQSVRFESSGSSAGNEPTWTLPDGWSSEGILNREMPGGMSMKIGNVATEDSEVAVSVSSMPSGQELLPNVNRWRGQLGLGPTNAIEMSMNLKQFKNDTVEFNVFDAMGPELSTRMGGGRPPFAGGMPGGNAAPIPDRPVSPHDGIDPSMMDMTDQADPKSATPAEPANIEFTPPADWTAGKSSSMIIGRWSKEFESGSIELMLMNMRATEESWKMNVEAWARQVKIDGELNIDELTTKTQVAGQDARKVRLDGPQIEETDDLPIVVAVMFQNPPDSGYVVKMAGDQATVDAAMDEFEKFIASISFPDPAD